MKRMLNYYDADQVRENAVMIDQVVRFSKSEIQGQDITRIHLINGEILYSTDSIITLQARIENDSN